MNNTLGYEPGNRSLILLGGTTDKYDMTKNIKIVVTSFPHIEAGVNRFYFNPVNWMLRLYHEKFSQSADHYTWTDPFMVYMHDPEESATRLIEKIKQDNIDILGFNMYVWSHEWVFKVITAVRQCFPHLTIVLGGPEVDAHRNKTFFQDHPHIDWVVYGDGENAFSNLLDKLSGFDVELMNIVSNNGHVYPHQVLNKKDLLSQSPYLTYQNEIVATFNECSKNLPDFDIVMVWETEKGCPYACTFCDWNSGLHNKVRFWGKGELIPNWRKEFDFFCSIGVKVIFWTNPNVGLTLRDTEIINHWCETSKTLTVPELFSPSWSKTKKEKVFELLDQGLTYNILSDITFSIQDLNEQILDNIERPEIPWESHRSMIVDLLEKHQPSGELWTIAYIWGLPGQTLDHLKFNMIEAGKLGLMSRVHLFTVLPSSPAADPAYIKKWELVTDTVKVKGGGLISNQVYTNAITSTSTLTEHDWFVGAFITFLHNELRKMAFADRPIGHEAAMFKNMHQINSIIERSYEHFKTTREVLVVTKHGPIGIDEWVYKKVKLLTKILYAR